MILFVALIMLAVLGAPLYALLGAASITLYLGLPEGTWEAPALDVFGVRFAESPTLMTIPLFVLIGGMLANAGTPRRFVNVVRAWLGWAPAGLVAVSLVTCAFFAVFSVGSSLLLVAVAGLLLPALAADDYPEDFSLGLVTSGGSLGLLFPPSVVLIVYGIVSGLVLSKLLVAGIVPGLVVLLTLFAYGAFVGRKLHVTRRPFVLATALDTLRVAKWELALPLVLSVGYALGVLRIHEAAALGVLYVLSIEVLVYRDLELRRDLPRIVADSMMLVGALLVIMVTAIGLSAWIVQTDLPAALLERTQALISNKYVFLVVLNVALLVVGMWLETFSAVILLVPLVLPLGAAYGIDPYHLAVVVLLNLGIGYVAPHSGVSLQRASTQLDKPLATVTTSTTPFFAALVVSLVIVTYVPSLTTWLPSYIDDDRSDTLGATSHAGVAVCRRAAVLGASCHDESETEVSIDLDDVAHAPLDMRVVPFLDSGLDRRDTGVLMRARIASSARLTRAGPGACTLRA